MTFWQIMAVGGGATVAGGLLMDTFGWAWVRDPETGDVDWTDTAERWQREYANHLVRIGSLVTLAGLLAWALGFPS